MTREPEVWTDPERPDDFPEPSETIARLAEATRRFLVSEPDLLEIGVNERTLTHRLAVYIEPYFDQWHTDCEYNRLGEKVKNLPRPEEFTTSPDDTSAITIFPDIIVHRRRTHYNCAVVEVKKSGNSRGVDLDVAKLCGLTAGGDYEYTVGLHLIIDCKNAAVAEVVAYRGGEVDDDLSAFAKGLFVG
ncbi:hypothetical protein FY036_01010 [Mesorhizobium microcysteis]|uniref:Uncharacterized protein n=1 Tax=Neoaquamicrobium microcysteis TaxID=2682781 RepID=A0A5D4H808_9HYPH|nr:hypothetical protein [Mesorhizobium microcysteis]TYR36432.1 hypothetical protein FY036_01010 [Mesorhizobium microcysteis]